MPTTALPPKPGVDYPRPPVVARHAELFREPVYKDGQPYADPDNDDGLEG